MSYPWSWQWAYTDGGGYINQAGRDVHFTQYLPPPPPPPPGRDRESLAHRRQDAEALMQTNQVQEARVRFGAMLADHRITLGDNDRLTLHVLHQLAWCNLTLNAPVHALEQYTELWQRSAHALGANDALTLLGLLGSMNATGAKGDFVEACSLGKDLVEAWWHDRGPADDLTLQAAYCYAHWLSVARRGTEARDLCADLYADLRKALPDHHPVLARTEYEYHRYREAVAQPRRVMYPLPNRIRNYSRYSQQRWKDGYID